MAFSSPSPDSRSGRVGGSTTAHRVSNARAQSRIAGESFMLPGAEPSALLGDAAHDGPHQGLPRPQSRRWAPPRRRSRRRARELSGLRQRPARHARVLRGQGESGARDSRSACAARLVLRHRLGRRDRAGAGRRRDARPHQLRQHDQEGKGHRARLCARDPPVRRGLRGRGGEDRPRCAGREGVLPNPVRRRGRGMAAVAQVRLRAGNGGRRARARARART